MRIGVDMYKVLYRIVFSLRRRLFDIWYPHVLQFFSPLILHLFPSNLGFFVGSDAINLDFKHHRLLPKLNYRLPYSKSMLDDFTVINVNAPIFSEVNVVFRGEVMIGEVNKEIPTLFLNPKDLTVVEGYKDVYLITADLGIFASFLGHKNGTPCYPCKREDHKVIFIRGNWFVKNEASIKNNLHKSVEYSKNREKQVFNLKTPGLEGDYTECFILHNSGMKNLQLGSGVGCLLYAINNSIKVNVYGWDQYLDNKLPDTFGQQVYSLWSCKSRIGTFATNLINWIYAYRIMHEFPTEKVNVKGRINGIRDMIWIKKKAFQIMYKNIH